MLFLQKWSAATAEEWYINRLWQFVLSMMGLKTNTSQALIQLITAARLLLGKNCSIIEESPFSVGNIVDCWLLPSHISPEQSRLATFPAALEASEGHFDTTVYCLFFFSDFYFIAPFFSGEQCFQLLWMPKMFAGCSWHFKPTVYCYGWKFWATFFLWRAIFPAALNAKDV